MKILVIGCGSIGKRHIKNLLSLDKNLDVIAWNRGEKRLKEVSNKFGIRTSLNLGLFLEREKPNVCFICSPSSLHLKHALMAAKHNCDIFIEKPLSHNLNNIKTLQNEIINKNLIVQVGANYRFHLGPKTIFEYLKKNKIGEVVWANFYCGMSLPHWHPKENYLDMYSSKKKLGGGVLLDIIHEIDLVNWFFGKCKKIIGRAYNSKTLGIQTEEFADIIFIYNNKNVCVHLDYLQYPFSRGIKIVGKKGILRWSFEDNFVEIIKKNRSKKIFFPKNYTKNDMYLEQLSYFLNCLKKRKQPHNDLHSGLIALQNIKSFKK